MKLTSTLGLLFAATAALASCSGSVLTDAHGVTTGVGGNDPTTTSATSPDPSACAAECKNRGSPGCFDETTCTDYCETESAHWSATEQAAFASCAATNPLCYELVEDCMIGVLYPDPIEQTVTIQAKGFSAEEGRTVHASLEVSGEMVAAAPQKVHGGAFSFSWKATMRVGGGQLVIYYVDHNGDGVCSPAVDVTGSVDIQRPPGFGVPSWSAEIDAPTPANFVCQYL